jgi:sec-independent protein translocase protein TatA
MPQLGVPELLIILVIIIAVFGAGKLANLGGALGKGVRDFRKNIKPEDDQAPKPEAPKAASSAEAEGSDSESASV